MAKKKKELSIAQTQESVYAKAVGKMQADELVVQAAYRQDNLLQAAELFEVLGEYRDAQQLAEECRRLADEAEKQGWKRTYQRAVARNKAATREDEWVKVEEALAGIADNYPPAKKMLDEVKAQRAERERKFRIGRGIRIGILAAVIALLAAGYTSGAYRYVLGHGFLHSGMLKQAAYEFRHAHGFADSEEMVEEIEKMKLRDAENGSDIEYGRYTWKVLDKDEQAGTMLLAATDLDKSSALYGIPFNETLEEVTWEESTLRTYLNEVFYYEAFDDEERSHLLLQTSSGVINAHYDTIYTEETTDYVTILSPWQAIEYQDIVKDLPSNWWLRGPGNTMDTAAYITGTHTPLWYGYPVNDEAMYTRAVILLDTEWLNESEEE